MQAQIQQASSMAMVVDSGGGGAGGGAASDMEHLQQQQQQQHHHHHPAILGATAAAHHQRAMAAAAAAMEREGSGAAVIAAAAAAAAAAVSAHYDEDEDEDEEDEESAAAAAAAAAGMDVDHHQQQQQQQQQQHLGTPAGAMEGGFLGDSARRQQPRPRTNSPGQMQMPVLPVPCCRVEGCGEDLSTAGDYHRRHKVCKMHATSPKVVNHGQEQRFCQQCSRFHALSEFDEGKRSCRKRLAGHNERRRRHQPDSLATTSSESPPLPPGRDGSKKPRDMKGRGRGGGRRGRGTGLPFTREESLLLRGDDISSKRRKAGEEFAIILNDSFGERKGKERGLVSMERRGLESNKDIDDLELDDLADMEQVKEGLDLGEGIIIPPLPMKRDGKTSMLKGWAVEGSLENAEEMQQVLDQMKPPKDPTLKNSWQRDDKEAFLHSFWDCPKVQPVWRWVARQLSKLRGSKVTLDMKQAVFGTRLESWATPEMLSVWKLYRGIVLWQIWLARKGKVSNGVAWTSNKVMRAVWVDLMMYAMQDWLEVLKKKEAQKQEDAYELRNKFDNKWLVNVFAGRRAEWTMIWKDPDDVLLD